MNYFKLGTFNITCSFATCARNSRKLCSCGYECTRKSSKMFV